jgi:hypothetical protein
VDGLPTLDAADEIAQAFAYRTMQENRARTMAAWARRKPCGRSVIFRSSLALAAYHLPADPNVDEEPIDRLGFRQLPFALLALHRVTPAKVFSFWTCVYP